MYVAARERCKRPRAAHWGAATLLGRTLFLCVCVCVCVCVMLARNTPNGNIILKMLHQKRVMRMNHLGRRGQQRQGKAEAAQARHHHRVQAAGTANTYARNAAKTAHLDLDCQAIFDIRDTPKKQETLRRKNVERRQPSVWRTLILCVCVCV